MDATIVESLAAVFAPGSLLLILVGVAIGIVFGGIPGLNTPIAVALVLPFTIIMDPVPTVCILMGIYMGGVSGGLIPAILLRIPGTAAAVATTFDGYPMTANGRASEALALGTFASLFGGLFSAVALFLLAPWLSRLAIEFGPWEYFSSVFLALSLVCVLVRSSIVKGFIAMTLGLLISCVGVSPIDGVAMRFTFGYVELENGFALIALIIGLFALPEVLNSAGNLRGTNKQSDFEKKWFYFPTWPQIRVQLVNMTRSSVIGTIVGIMPGMGGGPAGLIAYAQAQKASKTPELFGKGCPDGVAASESANNATTGGALIPMLALGVPGDTTTAIIMGAIALQGLTAGPLLSLNQPTLFKTIIFIVFVANIFMFLFQATMIRWLAKVLEVPKYILFPGISVFCALGVISINNNIFDLFYMFIFVVIGFILDKNKYPLPPFILANVLGDIIEDNLRRSIVYCNSFPGCLTQVSIGTLFFGLAVLFPALAIIKPLLSGDNRQARS